MLGCIPVNAQGVQQDCVGVCVCIYEYKGDCECEREGECECACECLKEESHSK